MEKQHDLQFGFEHDMPLEKIQVIAKQQPLLYGPHIGNLTPQDFLLFQRGVQGILFDGNKSGRDKRWAPDKFRYEGWERELGASKPFRLSDEHMRYHGMLSPYLQMTSRPVKEIAQTREALAEYGKQHETTLASPAGMHFHTAKYLAPEGQMELMSTLLLKTHIRDMWEQLQKASMPLFSSRTDAEGEFIRMRDAQRGKAALESAWEVREGFERMILTDSPERPAGNLPDASLIIFSMLYHSLFQSRDGGGKAPEILYMISDPDMEKLMAQPHTQKTLRAYMQALRPNYSWLPESLKLQFIHSKDFRAFPTTDPSEAEYAQLMAEHADIRNTKGVLRSIKETSRKEFSQYDMLHRGIEAYIPQEMEAWSLSKIRGMKEKYDRYSDQRPPRIIHDDIY